MNICIIGFGEIGKKYYKAIKKKSAVKVFIIDYNIKKKILKKKNLFFFKHIKELPIKEFFDLVIISTPPSGRLQVLKDLNEYKINKIIIEKPVALSIKGFNNILNIIKNKNYIVYTNYIRQFIKEFQKIKKIIKTRKLGKPLVGNFYYSKGIYYNGVHFIDFVVSIFGMPFKIEVISKKKSKTIKGDYIIDFILNYKNFKFFFIGFETENVSSSSFEIITQKGKIEVSSSRKYRLYKIKKNTLIKNINQFSVISEKKISYEDSFKNILKLVFYSKKKIRGFVTNDKKVYNILEKFFF